MVRVGNRMWKPMFRPNWARASSSASSMGSLVAAGRPHSRPAAGLELRMVAAVPPATRGKLKIFFGAFPGAGKTDAMLAAARRMREAGRDVVVGVIDMHGKPEEAAAIEGFEVVGSAGHGELDLDAVLARHPQVVLIDDLAHSNRPGSRHPKRWSDIDEILNAGIDVFGTVSVQHLDSL